MDIITVVVIGLLAAAVAVLTWGALRWRGVLKVGGINVALRWRLDQEPGDSVGWHLGIGRYQGEEFAWYRVLSLRRGPDRVLNRDDLHIAERRKPSGQEQYTLPAGSTVLQCESGAGAGIEIALASGALTGFLSWLEAAPPGHQIPRAS